MKFRFAILFIIISLPAVAAGYDVEQIIREKQRAAEKNRLETMRMIEQRRDNPTGYVGKQNEQLEISFKADSDGHFYIPAQVNGAQVRFLADTGASRVFLTQEDAKKIGLDVSNLSYSVSLQTANGTAYAADTVVKTFNVGPIQLKNMSVNVSRETGGVSLLGMTFFKKLSKYNVENGVLTLHK